MANLSTIKLHLALEEKEEEFRLAIQYLERVEEKGENPQPSPLEFENLKELLKLFPLIEGNGWTAFGAP